MNPLKKAFEFFTSLYGNSDIVRSGSFYPQQVPGYAAPPVNAARSSVGGTVTPKSAMETSAYWACVWLIADTIATLPFRLNRRDGTNAWGKPATDLSTYIVLSQRPNSMMTSADFWQFMIASMMLWGNAYAEVVRGPDGNCVALLPLLPQFMVPYRDPENGRVRYRYQPTGQQNNELEQDFSADQIFHLKDRSLDGMVGVSRVEYARNSLGIAKAAEQASADTYRNGLRSSGFLTYEKTLKPEQREQIKAALAAYRTGGPDSGGFMVLEGGMGFEQLNMTPQDVALLASRQFSVEDVCRWFNVPPVLIGHAAAGVSSWGSGIEQLLLGFQSLTLRPIIRKIEAAVIRALINPAIASTMYLSIDTDDLLGADSIARSQLYSTYSQNGIMTRNEIRAAEDRPPIDGGDKLTVQSNLIPLDKLGETPPAASGAPGNTPDPATAHTDKQEAQKMKSRILWLEHRMTQQEQTLERKSA